MIFNRHVLVFTELENGVAGCTDAGSQCRVIGAVCSGGRCDCVSTHFLRDSQCVPSKYSQKSFIVWKYKATGPKYTNT